MDPDVEARGHFLDPAQTCSGTTLEMSQQSHVCSGQRKLACHLRGSTQTAACSQKTPGVVSHGVVAPGGGVL